MLANKKKNIIYSLLLLIILLFIFNTNVFAENNSISMNFKGADIRDVLRTFAELADVNLITDGSVEGQITVKLSNETFDNALKLITQTHGLAYEWDGNTIVVATPEKIDKIYEKEQTTTVSANHTNVEDLKDILSGVIPDLNIQVDNQNNRLILKGSIEEIKEAMNTVNMIDTPKDVVVETKKINYTNIEKITNSLNDIYPELNVQDDIDNKQIILYGSENVVNNALSLVNKLDIAPEDDILKDITLEYTDIDYVKERVLEIYPDIKVVADSKNSQLVLSGTENEINQALQFVDKLDVKRKEATEVVTLNFTEVAQINDTINNLSPNLEITADDNSGQFIITGNKKEVKTAVELIKNMDEKNKEGTTVVGLDYIKVDEVEKIVTDLYPDIGIQINDLKKEIVVRGKKAEIDQVAELISKIDTPREQVIIEARVEEIKGTMDESIGANPDNLGQIEFKADPDLTGIILSATDFMKATANNSDITTLAKPNLMTLSGESAKMLIGDRIPVIVEKVEDGVSASTVEYIEVGVSLEFEPWVTSDNHVNLSVIPKVSTKGEELVNGLPPVNTREVETNVRLKDGETLAIGGLIQEYGQETESKIPILGDIPILGHIFKNEYSDEDNTELVIFITPHVVGDIEEEKVKDLKSSVVVSEPEESDDKDIEDAIESSKEDADKNDNGDTDNKVKENDNGDTDNKVKENDNQLETNETEKEESTTNSTQSNSDDDEFQGLSEEELDEILSVKDDKAEVEKENNIAANKEQEKNADKVVDNKNQENVEEDVDTTVAENESETDTKKKQAFKNKPSEPEGIAFDLDKYYIATYRVNGQETIESIASAYGINKKDIEGINAEVDTDNLKTGMDISIPVLRQNLYEIKKGETLWRVHEKYEVDIDRLKKINNIKDEDNIPTGEVLVLPNK
ncbi:MAG: secretin N-terminal domain-containing protein [Halothermotrichaceae bacterium]